MPRVKANRLSAAAKKTGIEILVSQGFKKAVIR